MRNPSHSDRDRSAHQGSPDAHALRRRQRRRQKLEQSGGEGVGYRSVPVAYDYYQVFDYLYPPYPIGTWWYWYPFTFRPPAHRGRGWWRGGHRGRRRGRHRRRGRR